MKKDFIASLWWYCFLFFVGAASTAVEITGLRFLAPLFGSSLPVWGSAIATVLAGLALGYHQGGKRAQRPVSVSLVVQYATVAAALFLLLPLLFRCIAWLRDASLTTGNPIPAAGALLIAFLTLLIPSVVFGMVSPLAVQAEAAWRKESAGHVAGRISALTTVGSLAGILIPSFLTIPLLGTRATVWLFAGVVLLFSLSHVRLSARLNLALLLLMGTALVGVVPSSLPPTVLLAAETAHQRIAVAQRGNRRILMFDAGFGVQSVHTDEIYTEGYWDYLATVPALLPQEDSELSVLVLGAATSTTERQLQRWWGNAKKFTFTSVELDKALFPVAEKYFAPPTRKMVADDARVFVNQDTAQYDIIVIDAYARELTVPFHLVTAEFFQELAARLAPHGIVAINANAAYADTLWVRSLTTTLARVFPEVRVASLPKSCNHLLLAAHTPWRATTTDAVPPPAATLLPTLKEAQPATTNGWLLTDDRAPTDLLGILALVESGRAPACDA